MSEITDILAQLQATTSPAPVDFDFDAWLGSFAASRKVEVSDLDQLDPAERSVVRERVFAWLRSYRGNFDFALDMARHLARKGQLSVGQVKGTLNVMRAEVVRASRPEPSFPEPDTFHVVDGEVFKAQAPKSGEGRVYLKRLVPGTGGAKGRWEYAGRDAIFSGAVTAATALTAAEAAAHGLATGICVVCGAELETRLSVEVGIGPVCVKRFGTTQRKLLAERHGDAVDPHPEEAAMLTV